MAMKDRRAEDLEALERLLEVYGADRTRWPARERLRFASFIAEDGKAHRLVAESAALDRLLDLVPQAGAVRERALADRIMAAALQHGQPKPAVVPMAAKGPRLKVPVWTRSLSRSFGGGSTWAPAGLLAACLVAGVMLGSSGTLDSTVQQVAEVAGFSIASDVPQLALGEELVASTGDDLL